MVERHDRDPNSGYGNQVCRDQKVAPDDQSERQWPVCHGFTPNVRFLDWACPGQKLDPETKSERQLRVCH